MVVHSHVNVLYVSLKDITCLQDMGTMVIGKVESGSVGKGSSLVMMPNRVSYRNDLVCVTMCVVCRQL